MEQASLEKYLLFPVIAVTEHHSEKKKAKNTKTI